MSTIQAIISGLRSVGVAAIYPSTADRDVLAAIHAQRSEIMHFSDPELADRVLALRRSKQGVANPHAIAEAFTLLDEAAHRQLGIRFYDVQFEAALAMLRHEIAEMKTGEGKTFVGALAAFVHAVAGRDVHFMTTNAYLAERDHAIVGPMFQRLGLTVGLNLQGLPTQKKREAYQCDVVYGPGYEFGFDYLRDQLAWIVRRRPQLGEQVQQHRRGEAAHLIANIQGNRCVAIIDEADSVLLDDATTPLILSSSTGCPNANAECYQLADSQSQQLINGQHYSVDAQNRRVLLTSSGHSYVRSTTLEERVRRQLRRPWPRYIENALSAHYLFGRDAHYIVVDDQVRIVDSSTGRVFEDRSWSDGLHQGVEAKEGVAITDENVSLARITRQQYFRLYAHLCGMTGTAADGIREFRQVYRLPVTVIPTHKPCQRLKKPTRFFVTEADKLDAIAQTVRDAHAVGQPVLVGTRTIEQSEAIASRLDGLNVQLLNGKQDADEASLIAHAGRTSAITIATNMAGRGTDIKLGTGVAQLGGLMAIVSEPHESARVDRQLIGRAARQGDPGVSQMFVSAEDNLIVRYAPWLSRFMKRIAGADGEICADLQREIVRLQKRVERKAAATRREMFSREHWLEETLSQLANEDNG